MGAATQERKLAAILSADVVGYSRLMAEDESATIRTLTDYREAVSMLVRQHRGRVVDSPGDNLLADFPTALDAVRAAVEIQRVIGARNADLPPERRMEFRIGVHLGDIRAEGERIYGDGVNVAARLEGLAQPGGVCISDVVYNQVEKKLSVELEDLGEQTLKNISRPVHVYGVKLLLAQPEIKGTEKALPGMEELTVPGFGGRPAIAVLPFDNLSGDPEQEYFADGIAEDLITGLSAWRSFPVIARNSSFVYKGRAVSVKEVSLELGVRYVVEGSVRKAGERVRISAQLIDTTTGHHVWAERYDREFADIFSLQDEITEAMVASMHPELWRFEGERAARKEPQNLDAWERAHRGWWHFNKLTREHNAKARDLLEEALELDPDFGWAYFALSQVHALDMIFDWTDSPERSNAELLRTAQKCVSLDDKDPFGHLALATSHAMTGLQDKVIAAAELALQLNPSLPMAYQVLGGVLGLTGRPDDGIALLEKGMRLSPHDPMLFDFFAGIALAHFAAGRYERAVDWAQRSLQRRPDYAIACDALAASWAQLGRLDEARVVLAERLRLHPASVATLQRFFSFTEPGFLDRYVDGLRKAGMPEG